MIILLRAKQNEGEDASPPCKAGWYVSIFSNEQNHPLSAICEEKRQWNSHSEINPVLMIFIKNLKAPHQFLPTETNEKTIGGISRLKIVKFTQARYTKSLKMSSSKQ